MVSSMFRTYKFPAKVSSATHERLDAFLLEIMAIWNMALEHRIRAYKEATGLADAKRLKKALDEALAEDANAGVKKESRRVKEAKKAY